MTDRRWYQLLLVVLVFPLAACGYFFGDKGPFRDRAEDYQKAQVAPSLQLPETSGFQVRELYPVPDPDQRLHWTGEKYRLPEPPLLVEVPDDYQSPVPGQVIKEEQIVLSEDGNGFPVLTLDLGLDWSWSLVGESLERSGITITDRNRDAAVYYIRIDREPEPDDGKDSGKRKKKPGHDIYQLKLTNSPNGVQVALLEDSQTLAPAKTASVVLELVRMNLIAEETPAR